MQLQGGLGKNWEKANSGHYTASATDWWYKYALCNAKRSVQPGSLLNRTAINMAQETFLKTPVKRALRRPNQ